MSDSKLVTTSNNINNQKIFKEIDTFIVEVFSINEIKWTEENYRTDIVQMIEEFMYELAVTTDKIVQFDIMCDRRNNPKAIHGTVNLTVKYKQKNCLNTSEINYVFTI